MNGAALAVAQHLDLDVARPAEILLDIDRAIAERRLRLGAAGVRLHLVTVAAQRLAGKVLEDAASPHRLTNAFGQRLALFPRQQAAQRFAASVTIAAGASTGGKSRAANGH